MEEPENIVIKNIDKLHFKEVPKDAEMREIPMAIHKHVDHLYYKKARKITRVGRELKYILISLPIIIGFFTGINNQILSPLREILLGIYGAIIVYFIIQDYYRFFRQSLDKRDTIILVKNIPADISSKKINYLWETIDNLIQHKLLFSLVIFIAPDEISRKALKALGPFKLEPEMEGPQKAKKIKIYKCLSTTEFALYERIPPSKDEKFYHWLRQFIIDKILH